MPCSAARKQLDMSPINIIAHLMIDTTIAVHHISQDLVHLLRDSLLQTSQIEQIAQLLSRKTLFGSDLARDISQAHLQLFTLLFLASQFEVL